MAVKISELPAASSVALTDEFEVNQAGTSRKATAAQIAASVFVNTAPTLGWYSPSADLIRTPNSVTIDDQLVVSGTGPHAIGGSALDYTRLRLTGSFTSGGASNRLIGVFLDGTLTAATGDTSFHTAVNLQPDGIVTQGATEVITTISTLRLTEPIITVGTGDTVTNTAVLYIASVATEGTNNYALWVDAGNTRLDGNLDVQGGTVTLSATTNIFTTSTSDGSDNARILLAGGGAASSIRGAQFQICGNENAEAGNILLNTGDVAGSSIKFQNNGTTIASVLASGIFINDTANANMTVGLTINQGANTNQAFTIKGSFVTHGLTSAGGNFETDDYFSVKPVSGTAGGAQITAIGEDDTGSIVLLIDAFGRQADTNDTTTSSATITFRAAEHNAANAFIDSPANANLAVWQGRAAGAFVTRMLLKADDGELHLGNTTLVALDDEDDARLARAMQKVSSSDGIVLTEYDNPFDNYEWLRSKGLVGPKDERGEFLFPLQSRLHAHEGAIWQGYVRQKNIEKEITEVRGEITRLQAIESRLAAIENKGAI